MPDALKDANRDAEALGHGEGYEYPHSHAEHFVGQQYLPEEVMGTYFYMPSDQGYELEVDTRLKRWRAAQRKALGIDEGLELPDLSVEEIEALKRKQRPGGVR